MERFNSKFISASEALFAWVLVRLSGEVIVERMVLGHVVKNDHSVLSLVWLHFLKIDFFNREEHFGANFTHSSPLAGNRFANRTLSVSVRLFNTLTFYLELQYLNFFIEVKHVN